ncbi:NifB/NifX family molybdenum-iron cluster-binding protein [Vibrio sp. RC27]
MFKSERKLHVEPTPDDSLFRIKVGFTTLDRHRVDQHFGSAKCVLIYGLNETEWHLLEAIEYSNSNSQTHDKLPIRIGDLSACSAVYCNACGPSAIRQLLDKGIHPVKVTEGSNIHDLMRDLQLELIEGPTGWLSRAIKTTVDERQKAVDKAQRLSDLMDEDW